MLPRWFVSLRAPLISTVPQQIYKDVETEQSNEGEQCPHGHIDPASACEEGDEHPCTLPAPTRERKTSDHRRMTRTPIGRSERSEIGVEDERSYGWVDVFREAVRVTEELAAFETVVIGPVPGNFKLIAAPRHEQKRSSGTFVENWLTAEETGPTRRHQPILSPARVRRSAHRAADLCHPAGGMSAIL